MLPKEYNPQEAEKRWQAHWQTAGTYAFRDDQPRDNTFVIDTPPPTVSGVLHMGHVFSYCQADFVARYQRMSGRDVFYPMGFDDNGLPTERLVEKIKGKKASQYESREAFVADCREVVAGAEEEFRALFRSIALSVDWKLEYQTVSDRVRALSQRSFIELLQKGEAYRDFRPTYWDWVDQTAIAQAEIENKELPGVMNEIRFTLEDGSPLVIATTRPELLGACVAVMYHPEDPNAAKYKGKYTVTPLFGVKVPMIADELVEREKGTGLVMCCTFGDDTDKEWQRKHELPTRTLLDLDGRIRFAGHGYDGSVISDENESLSDENMNSIIFLAGKSGRYDQSQVWERNCVDIKKAIGFFKQIENLKPKQANAKIIELLQADGMLLKQTNIMHTVKCAERSGTPIEIIPTYQWFVKIIDKKDALIARGAECHWYPEFMRVRLNQWTEGLKEDWCISRQRFFGVPFPVWYVLDTDTMKIVDTISAKYTQLPINPLRDKPELPERYTFVQDNNDGGFFVKDADGKSFFIQGDKDVMDTWATSSLTPQINAQSLASCKLFPADLRPQAHEIIRTWAFYTIVKAHLHAATIPWKNLMISGWCLAADKSKMSKSKGNVVTPVSLIEEKGADAVRYWASTSRLGADTAFSEDALKIGRKLVTKLWNAANFVSLQLEKLPAAPTGTAASDATITAPLDKWIISQLRSAVDMSTRFFEQFEYCDARIAVEDFFWNDFCDNYLELVKARAYEGEPSALHTLHYCLDAILRLFAPFVPHVTEEVYTHLFASRGSVHARGAWPKAADYPRAETPIPACGLAIVEVLAEIRKTKSEAGVSIKFPVERVEIQKDTFALLNGPSVHSMLADLKAAGNVTGEIVEGQGAEIVVQLAKEAAA